MFPPRWRPPGRWGRVGAASCRCEGRDLGDLGQFSGRTFRAVRSDTRLLHGELPLNRRPAPTPPKLVWWSFRRKFQSRLMKMLVNSEKSLLFLAYPLCCWGKKNPKVELYEEMLVVEPFVSVCKQIFKFPH